MRRDQRRMEGRQDGAADPALGGLEMEDPSQGQRRVEDVDRNGDLGGCHARTGENPRNLNLGKRVLAMAVLGPAVIRSN
jgi:hypothetical protein